MSFKIKITVLLASLVLMALLGYMAAPTVGKAVRLAASAVWGA